MPVLDLEIHEEYQKMDDSHFNMATYTDSSEADDVSVLKETDNVWGARLAPDCDPHRDLTMNSPYTMTSHHDHDEITEDTHREEQPDPSSAPQLCTGCLAPISDRYLLRAAGGCWHEDCLRCSVCSSVLTSSCFVKDRRLLCRHDYARLYGARCSSCFLPLPPQEMVMRAQGRVYHVRCFTCVACGHLLQHGDQYVVHNDQLFCRLDFEKELVLHMRPTTQLMGPDCFSLYPPKSDCGDSLDDNDPDQSKGPKRPRTILTTSQRRKFKNSFELNPKPCRKVRESLAQETGLTVRVVQVWFQNQRAKMKKIARKQNSENDGEKKSNKDGSKKSQHTSEKSLNKKTKCKSSPSERDFLKTDNCMDFTQQLTTFSATSPDGYPCHDGQSHPVSHHMPELESILSSQGQDHADIPRCHEQSTAPINRLFGMQESYFSPS